MAGKDDRFRAIDTACWPGGGGLSAVADELGARQEPHRDLSPLNVLKMIFNFT